MPEFKDPTYFVHSGGRDQASRNRRGRAAGHRFVQKLAGGAVTVRHKRPAIITAAQLILHLPQMQDGWKAGFLEVRTMGGALVDLMSGDVSAKDIVSEPAPNFRLDSAANDKTFAAGVGQHIPQFEDGLAEGQSGEVPSLLAELQEEQEEHATEPVAEEPAVQPPVVEEPMTSIEEPGDPALIRKQKKGKKE